MGREQGLNESVESASSMPTWRGGPRTATAYPHDWRGAKLGLVTKPCTKSLAAFICQRLCPPLASPAASMPSSLAWANRDYKTDWFHRGQISVSEDSVL